MSSFMSFIGLILSNVLLQSLDSQNKDSTGRLVLAALVYNIFWDDIKVVLCRLCLGPPVVTNEAYFSQLMQLPPDQMGCLATDACAGQRKSKHLLHAAQECKLLVLYESAQWLQNASLACNALAHKCCYKTSSWQCCSSSACAWEGET